MQREVQQQMNKARLDIEDKLIPKGVSRYIALPEEGKSLEWILAEMVKMDGEMGPNADWRHAKLSGAIYRTSVTSLHLINYLTLSNRWRRGYIKSDRRCF